MQPHIAFIGLGHMGAPMALNLHKKGYPLQVFDLSVDATNKLAMEGITVAAHLHDVVKGAYCVITMLPADHHVLQLYLGEQGLLAHLPAGTLIIDCSTISASAAVQLATHAQEKQQKILDAPVSGGTAGASAGTLTFMVGGKQDDLEQALPILQAMGKNIFHAGQHGAGQLAKACNNMLLGILMAGTAEALALGARCGLDPHILSTIMAQSSGNNWALQQYNPWPGIMADKPASHGYEGGFVSALMLKDLILAEKAALEHQAITPLGTLVRNLYQTHVLQGAGPLDFSSILQHYQPE